MKSLLWISPYVPYDTVDHAGGKNHNYYLKYLKKSEKFDITLLTLAQEKQISQIDLNEYGIKYEIKVIKNNKFHTLIRYMMNIESEYSPFNKLCGVFSNYQKNKLVKLIKEYATKNKNKPDIVILQWTQTILLMPLIKTLFSTSKIVTIEEDVVFLGYERKMNFAKTLFSKFIWQYKYKKIKIMEINVLKMSDLVVVNNYKDYELLSKEGIILHKLFLGPIYFDNYSNVKRNILNKNIIFYGAMGRKENYLSVKWFIETVMPLIKDADIKLIVIGGGGSKTLKSLNKDNIQILGYVPNLNKYFQESLCLIAPLVLGAGIKVKVLEAFSAGIPVLTNNIGIEGIPAKAGKDYLHCEEPIDYITNINYLINNMEKTDDISKNARNLINEKFKTDVILEELIKKICNL